MGTRAIMWGIAGLGMSALVGCGPTLPSSELKPIDPQRSGYVIQAPAAKPANVSFGPYLCARAYGVCRKEFTHAYCWRKYTECIDRWFGASVQK